MVETILTIPNENDEPITIKSYSTGNIRFAHPSGHYASGGHIEIAEYGDDTPDNVTLWPEKDRGPIATGINISDHVKRRIEVELSRHGIDYSVLEA